MARVGKRCSRCGVYYAGERMDGKLCPWCSKAEPGNSSKEPDTDVLEALEL